MAIAASAKTDFGPKMKRVREERGVSLRHIADATKLSVAALEALERNDISRLPGGIFSRAFVRSYALEVGLDPEQTVREFLVQFPEDSVTAGSPYVARHELDEVPRTRGGAAVLVVLMALVALVGGVIALFTLSAR